MTDNKEIKQEAREEEALRKYEVTCFNGVAIYSIKDLVKLLDKATLAENKACEDVVEKMIVTEEDVKYTSEPTLTSTELARKRALSEATQAIKKRREDSDE